MNLRFLHAASYLRVMGNGALTRGKGDHRASLSGIMTAGYRVDSTYQPVVDGLRAVAVLPVVLFHGGFAWMSGGYIGVDVFFVISGYLITSIILAEQSQGRFRLRRSTSGAHGAFCPPYSS